MSDDDDVSSAKIASTAATKFRPLVLGIPLVLALATSSSLVAKLMS